MGWLLLA